MLVTPHLVTLYAGECRVCNYCEKAFLLLSLVLLQNGI